VLLPCATKERILIQFACAQSGLFCHAYEKASFTEHEIRERMRLLAIDCLITNVDHLETINKSTYNSMRPLKKLLIDTNIVNEPLPVGWYRLNDTNSSVLMNDDDLLANKHFIRLPINSRISQSLQLKSTFSHLFNAYVIFHNLCSCAMFAGCSILFR
jgi:hypothetical protein